MGIAARFLIWFLFYYASIFVHELGHLTGAIMVRWKPLYICLGKQNRRTIFKIGDLQFQLGSNPFSGMVLAVPLRPDYYRLKECVYIGGGMVASLCIFLVFIQVGFVSDRIESLPEWWQTTMQGILVITAIHIIYNFIPRNSHIEGRTVPNDARALFSTLRLKKEDVKLRFARDAHYLGRFLLNEGRLTEAREIILRAYAVSDPLGGVMFWIHFLLTFGKKSEANAEINKLLEQGFPHRTRTDILDSLACLPIYYGHLDLMDDAMRYIDEAIASEPGMNTLKASKGSLLIEQDSLDEGITMLEETVKATSSDHDMAICEYYLALAFHKKHDTKLAHRHFNQAVAKDPNSIVRRRMEREILRVTQTATGNKPPTA